MSQYNTPLVADMIATGPQASAAKNDSMYPHMVANHVVMGEIATAKGTIADLRTRIEKGKSENPTKDQQTIHELQQRVNTLEATDGVRKTRALINQMIEGNMSLVISKVESYINVYPDVAHLRDDLVGEGILGLTEAVNRMAAEKPRKDANPTGYISFWIKKMIGEVVDTESACTASASTSLRKRKSGESLPKAVPLAHNASEMVVDPTSIVELRDLIEACCETPEDRLIVEMREKRYTDKEIAARLELPHTTVYMMRREIYARFLAKSGLKGEV